LVSWNHPGEHSPMPIITLCGSKGGSGKSTIAINLAAEWHRRGRRTLLVDADPQGTACTWREVAAERGCDAPPVTAVGDALRSDVPRIAAGHEVTVIDTAGRQSKRLVGALMISDLALIPCQPGATDMWAVSTSLEAAAEARELRPSLQVVLVVNGKTATAIGKSARKALAGLGVPVLRAELGQRVAFAEAPASGKGITGYQPGSVAAYELRTLADEIEDLVGLTAEVAAHA